MRGPAFSITSEIYVKAHELTAIFIKLHPPKGEEYFADVIYSILKRKDLENFLHHINNLHKDTKLTMDEIYDEKQHFIETD